MPNHASPTITARTSSVRAGSRRNLTSPREPVSTAWQKKSVAPVPKTPLVGTAYARGRQPSDQVTGSVHCSFRFGPVGPLKNASWSSPQRPS